MVVALLAFGATDPLARFTLLRSVLRIAIEQNLLSHECLAASALRGI